MLRRPSQRPGDRARRAVLQLRQRPAAGGRSATTSLADLDGFAWDWGKAHDGVLVDVDRLVGFCLLIRREVIDTIGLFDERFGHRLFRG